MKPQIQSLSFALAVTMATCLSITACPAGAEEVSYSFDFDDGMIPDELNPARFPISDPLTLTLTCDASGGQLRVYDTVSASCEMEFRPADILTNTFISAVVNPTGGYLRGNPFLFTRGGMSEETEPDNYVFFLRPGLSGIAARMEVYKRYDGIYKLLDQSPYLYGPGPYLMQFEVADLTVEGDICTDLTARVSYNNSQVTETLRYRDWSSSRVPSGIAGFGAYLGADQRNAGWKLDVTFDDVTIRGTLVPEPGGATLLVAGTMLSAWRRRRQRRTMRT